MHTQLGGLLDHQVHALVGRHAQRHGDGNAQFALDRVEGTESHHHLAAAHAQHRRVPLAAAAVEQPQRVTRLQAAHLHMACGRGGQLEFGVTLHGSVDVQAHAHGLQCAR